MMRLLPPSVRFLVGGWAFLALATTWADQIVTLEGDWLEGRITEITPEQELRLTETESWPLKKLRAIVPSEQQVDVSPAKYTVWLTNGSRFSSSEIKLEDETYQLSNPVLGNLEVPIDLVWAIRLGRPDFTSRFAAAVRNVRFLEEDIIYVTGTGTSELQEVNGLIDSLDATQLSFDQAGEIKILPSSQVHAVILASPFFTPETDDWTSCRITLSDGSVISGRIAEMRDGQVYVELDGTLQITLAWNQVRRITVDSDLLHYLSDLEPTETAEEAIYAFPRPWRRDANVRGAALRLGKDRFEKGLGVSSGTRLTFANDADYTLFTATIGLDSESGQWGDCEFVVLADNREVLRERLRGGDSPRFIKLDVESIEEISLVVEPGIARLDLGDDANWCEACFLQKEED